MMPKPLLHILISATGLAQLAHAAAKASSYPQGSQYIRFSGTVSGTATWEPNIVPAGVDYTSCREYNSGPHPRTDLYVGVNPPWDTNPFFFELYHLVSNDCPQLFCDTSDSIMNLYFASAAYECFRGDHLCGLFGGGDHYESQVYLELKQPGSKANIQKVQLGGKDGYTVKGGPDTWVGTVDGNIVDTRADCQWVTGQHVAGYSWMNFVWNKTTPLDYTLTFTNTSASLTLVTKMISPSLSRAVSTMTLSFSGERNDTQEGLGANKTFHDLNPIQLNTNDELVPKFNFLNVSQIYFAGSNRSWTVAATPLPQSRPTASVSRSSRTSVSSTATTSSRNAAPTLANNVGVVVTAVMAEVMVYVFRLV